MSRSLPDEREREDREEREERQVSADESLHDSLMVMELMCGQEVGREEMREGEAWRISSEVRRDAPVMGSRSEGPMVQWRVKARREGNRERGGQVLRWDAVICRLVRLLQGREGWPRQR